MSNYKLLSISMLPLYGMTVLPFKIKAIYGQARMYCQLIAGQISRKHPPGWREIETIDESHASYYNLIEDLKKDLAEKRHGPDFTFYYFIYIFLMMDLLEIHYQITKNPVGYPVERHLEWVLTEYRSYQQGLDHLNSARRIKSCINGFIGLYKALSVFANVEGDQKAAFKQTIDALSGYRRTF